MENTEDMKKKENLLALETFVKKDMQIKELLLRLAPSELDESSEQSRMQYVDKLYKNIGTLQEKFLTGIHGLNLGEDITEAIKAYFEKVKESFLNTRYDAGSCTRLYSSQFSGMDPNFVESVKKTCVGYAVDKGIDVIPLLGNAKTVNELLHAIHSYVFNDENILQSMPIIGKKQNTIGEPITLYGDDNKVAQKIFDEFPLEMDCGITDIIALNGKVLMMVRDRGHALTIDMDTSKEGNVDVRYFVPKLCNIEMVENLPGINRSSITNNGATGFFTCTDEDIGKSLFSFIEKVPTDADITEEYFQMLSGKVTVPVKEEKPNQEVTFKTDEIKEMTFQQGSEGRKFEKVFGVQGLIKNAINRLRGVNVDRGEK